jgi:hypothetical protein
LRYVLVLAAFIAALALPLLTPAPVSAGGSQSECPDGYDLIPIAIIQAGEFGPRPGIARAAAAADVNHDELVCYKFRGARGVTFIDNIVYFGG